MLACRDKMFADGERDFETYLDEEVFRFGRYTYKNDVPAHSGETRRVAEYEDGGGFVMRSDLERAVEMPQVEVLGIKNGWVLVRDKRPVSR